MTQCQTHQHNNEMPLAIVGHPVYLIDRDVVELLNNLQSLPNLQFLCYYANWNPGTRSFDRVLTDFGERLQSAVRTQNRTLLHYLYQEAIAEQMAALEAIQGVVGS